MALFLGGRLGDEQGPHHVLVSRSLLLAGLSFLTWEMGGGSRPHRGVVGPHYTPSQESAWARLDPAFWPLVQCRLQGEGRARCRRPLGAGEVSGGAGAPPRPAPPHARLGPWAWHHGAALGFLYLLGCLTHRWAADSCLARGFPGSEKRRAAACLQPGVEMPPVLNTFIPPTFSPAMGEGASAGRQPGAAAGGNGGGGGRLEGGQE